MRKKFRLLTLLAIAIIPLSCLKDHVNYTYTIQTPVLQTLSSIRASMKTFAAEPLQNPGKIYSYGQYIFLNERDKGIHVIDNSDPSKPKNIGFIKIPGNEDLAIKGSILYADSYGDLVALDISDPLHAAVKKIIGNVFKNHTMYYNDNTNPDSVLIITDWIQKDTTVNFDTYNRFIAYYGGCANCMIPLSMTTASSATTPNQGTGGSLARFTLVNDFLYTLSSPDLSSFDITTPADPSFAGKTSLDWNAETLFPFKDKLFVGASTGMFIFDIQSNPAVPQAAGQFTHVRSCDPVVTDGDYAYVTLSSGTTCMGFDNELDIVNISNLANASLKKVYPLTHPRGLGKDGNILFICDDLEGIKVYDAADVNNLHLLKQCKNGTMLDVIAQHGLALVLGLHGLYEYDYSDINNIHLVGTLLISGN